MDAGLVNKMRGKMGPEMGGSPMEDNRSPNGDNPMGGKKLSPIEELQGDIAFGITGSMMYQPEAAQSLLKAYEGGGDPAAITANFISQLVLNTAERLKAGQGPQVSDNVWMAKNGVVERLIESAAEISEAKAGMEWTPEMKQQTFMEVADIMKAGAQAMDRGAQQAQGGQPMGGQPPMPQMGMGQPTPGMGRPPQMTPPTQMR